MVQHLKAALRTELLAKRDSLPAEQIMGFSAMIAKRVLAHPRFKEAKRIGIYIRKGSEVDTSMILDAAIKAGKEVSAPATGHEISFFSFTSKSELRAGKYGIMEPPKNNLAEPELIIVPGVAFGLCMHRLGYGKGYYDKYLAKSFAYRIGVCFDFQVVEKLPRHEDDMRMDEIITEKRAILL